MQGKVRIAAGVAVALTLLGLLIYIFFSALQSSRAIEELLVDIHGIERNIISGHVPEISGGAIKVKRGYMENSVKIMENGILALGIALSWKGEDAVKELYSMMKTKLIIQKETLYIGEDEIHSMKKNINLIEESILESSRKQKSALIILFVLLLATTGVLLFLLLAATVKQDKRRSALLHNRELAQAVSESENRTHNMLSSELHDDIGQMLVFLKMKVLERCPEISRDVDLVIDKVRKLSHGMKIPDFSDGQLTASIKELISVFATVSKIRIEHTISRVHNDNYPEYYPVLIFRVVQECLQNTLKHSNADFVRINLVESAPYLLFRYRDNGNGIEENDRPVVLKSIEERATLLSADLKLETGKDKGILIVLKIPFKKDLY